MHAFIQQGTRIQTEVGADERPESVRWITWGGGPLKQSYALISTEGAVLIDPVRPIRPDKTSALPSSIFKQYTGHKHLAIICTTALYERSIYWFRENYDIPIYVPKKVAPAFEGKPDRVYQDRDVLPAGVQELWIGADQKGEMVLHWRAPDGAQILICGDAIYGQSSTVSPKFCNYYISGLTELNAQNPVVWLFIAVPHAHQRPIIGETGNYNIGSIDKPIVNTARCSLQKLVNPNMLSLAFNQYTQA